MIYVAEIGNSQNLIDTRNDARRGCAHVRWQAQLHVTPAGGPQPARSERKEKKPGQKKQAPRAGAAGPDRWTSGPRRTSARGPVRDPWATGVNGLPKGLADAWRATRGGLGGRQTLTGTPGTTAGRPAVAREREGGRAVTWRPDARGVLGAANSTGGCQAVAGREFERRIDARGSFGDTRRAVESGHLIYSEGTAVYI